MNTVVMGAQWGDEGKGKIVDYLADNYDLVVRYSGGANAGHTIVIGDQKIALHQVPSGILSPNKKVILGTGMVINFDDLTSELEMLTSHNINWQDRIYISDRAHVVLPSYKTLDKKQESERAKPIGTTGRGIGIAYSLKSSRDGYRIIDLIDMQKTEDLFLPDLFEKEDEAYIIKYLDFMKKYSIDLVSYLHENKNKSILFEGAQGAMLDLDNGTYPYVSSGMSGSIGALAQGIQKCDSVIGVFKAYSTRVGNGPFVTELKDDLGNYIRERGHEYGTTTGRPRRCGNLDLVALKHAVRVNAITELYMTHLDIYDEMKSIDVCVAYEISSGQTTDFPSSNYELENAKKVTTSLAGWQQDITSVAHSNMLPKNAKSYIEFIERFVECKITCVSVGPDRCQTILM